MKPSKNKIIKIIKDNYNVSEAEASHVADVLIKEYDLESPNGGLSEESVIENADDVMSKKTAAIVSKVMIKLSKKPEDLTWSEIGKTWKSKYDELLKQMNSIGEPWDVSAKDWPEYSKKFNLIKLNMDTLDEEVIKFMKNNKHLIKSAKEVPEFTESQWNSMMVEWEIKRENLEDQLEDISDQLDNFNEKEMTIENLKKIWKKHNLIKLNIEVLEEDADDFYKRIDLKSKSAALKPIVMELMTEFGKNPEFKKYIHETPIRGSKEWVTYIQDHRNLTEAKKNKRELFNALVEKGALSAKTNLIDFREDSYIKEIRKNK